MLTKMLHDRIRAGDGEGHVACGDAEGTGGTGGALRTDGGEPGDRADGADQEAEAGVLQRKLQEEGGGREHS